MSEIEHTEEIARLRGSLARASKAQSMVETQKRRIAELEAKNRALEESLLRPPPASPRSVLRTMAAPLTLGSGSIQYMVEITLKE